MWTTAITPTIAISAMTATASTTANALAARRWTRLGVTVRLVVICRPLADSSPSVVYSLPIAETPRTIAPTTPMASSEKPVLPSGGDVRLVRTAISTGVMIPAAHAIQVEGRLISLESSDCMILTFASPHL